MDKENISKEGLVCKLEEKFDEKNTRNFLSDSIVNGLASIPGGVALDYIGKLTLEESIFARSSGFLMNFFLGSAYGIWRDKIVKTKYKEKPIRTYFSDLFAYNSFHMTIYDAQLTLGMLSADRSIDLEKLYQGAQEIFFMSLVAAPILSWALKKGRKISKSLEQ